MATFTNVTNGFLIITDQFGVSHSFQAGETKSGLSNYFERFTSAYLSGEKILLRRTGNLDDPGLIPVAGIEEENLAIQPGAPNPETSGIYGNIDSTPGGFKGTAASDIVATTFADSDAINTSDRRRKVVFNPVNDDRGREIDTRYLGIRSSEDLDVLAEQAAGTIASAADVDTYFDAADGIRGTFFVDSGVLLILTNTGIFEIADSTNPTFTAWT